MGKKKSVVLMVLLTILIALLCAITAFPAFPLPGRVDKWNPAVLQFDLGADLGGGYYAYYYPEGVISETEYTDNLSALEEAAEAAEGAEKTKAEEEVTEYVNSYLQHGGLYLSTDTEDNILLDGEVTEEFEAAFNGAKDAIVARFNAKNYSDYTVMVVDDYALRIELPKSAYDPNNTLVNGASAALTYFANTGDITLKVGGEVVDELEDESAQVSNLIKSVNVATKYKTSYLSVKFTAEGKEMLERVKGTLSTTSEANSNSSSGSSTTTLDIVIGDETVVSLYKDQFTDSNEGRAMFVDQEYKEYLQTIEILINSAMEKGGYEVGFALSAIRSFEPVYGANVYTLLLIALGLFLLAILVVPVVKMGRFGIVSGYATLSYFLVTLLCFAFISGGVFEITLGSVLVFVAGLILTNALQYYIYNAIKTEFAYGKTVVSSVKGGYKKTLFGIIDIYAVLILAALAFLIGAGGLHTLALQMLVCVITAAFNNLLWARAINFTFLSASKDKYKYFRFVREDEDDE